MRQDRRPPCGTTVTVLGRVVCAEYIGALVQGLPSLPNGNPAVSLFAQVLRRGADAVPPGYGDAIGNRIYWATKQTFFDESVEEEAMLSFIVTAVRGRVYLTAGCPVFHAERYVMVAIKNAAKNVLRGRSRKQRGEVPFEHESYQDEPRVHHADPITLDEQERAVMRIDLRNRLVKSLARNVMPEGALRLKNHGG